MKIWNLIKTYKKSVITSLVIVIVLALILPKSTKPEDKKEEEKIKNVTISSVENLSKDITPLPSIGKVVSKSEANIRTETQGEIIGVYRNVGDFVYTGTIIAEIENSSQKAVVSQAQAVLDSAKNNFEKISKGGRPENVEILNINLAQAEISLKEAKISTINTLKSVYTTADNIIRNTVDQLFEGPKTSTPELIFFVTNSQLKINIESEKPIIENLLNNWSIEKSLYSVDDSLILKLDKARDNFTIIGEFLNNMASAVNSLKVNSNLTQTTINGWKAAINSARTSLNSAMTLISQAKNSLNSKTSAYEVAQKQLEIGSTGQNEDVKNAESAVKQAEASLKVAEINLEKTIIRSPISGTVNELTVDRGDFVSIFEPVLVVSNNNILEIISFITEEDVYDISIGSKVMVEKKWEGKISRIAPSINSKTKKIEVTIDIFSPNAKLTNGESVSIDIERINNDKDDENTQISVPISALRVTSNSMFVFTVENKKLVAHPVIVGSIIGEKIIIEEGLTLDMEIVIDARSLKEGQEVKIN